MASGSPVLARSISASIGEECSAGWGPRTFSAARAVFQPNRLNSAEPVLWRWSAGALENTLILAPNSGAYLRRETE